MARCRLADVEETGSSTSLVAGDEGGDVGLMMTVWWLSSACGA